MPHDGLPSKPSALMRSQSCNDGSLTAANARANRCVLRPHLPLVLYDYVLYKTGLRLFRQLPMQGDMVGLKRTWLNPTKFTICRRLPCTKKR